VAPHDGNCAGHSWMGMNILVERAILQTGWEKEQVIPADSLVEDKELNLAYQAQVVVMTAPMNHLGHLAGYVQRSVVWMDHNFGICGQTITNFVIKK
jgi:hypothetical protein